jgi:hypothetical protein
MWRDAALAVYFRELKGSPVDRMTFNSIENCPYLLPELKQGISAKHGA